MNNELRILPLREYEVTYVVYGREGGHERQDVFTADHHTIEDGRAIFRRTGNIIREYQCPVIRIVVTPVDGE